MDQIKIYTKKRCPYCTAAKMWLSQRDYDYTEISLDEAVNQTEFSQNYPYLRTVPQIFIGDKNIGGFNELTKSKLA